MRNFPMSAAGASPSARIFWRMKKGRRRVRKEALYPEGREHVENICRWYALFSEQCRGTNLRYNHCEKTPEGIELEYVEGITLEDHLANLEKEQGTEAMISILWII